MTSDMVSASWEDMRVSMVGAGMMGRGIACAVAQYGAEVVLSDATRERALESWERLQTDVAQYVSSGLLDSERARTIVANVSWAVSIQEGVADADLIMEAVAEDPGIKHQVLQEIQHSARDGVLIASNTSSIPIARLAESLSDPGRMVGVHWFNPALFIPGVEVIPGPSTTTADIDMLVNLLRAAGRSPVVVADSPGFVGNRLQFALLREALLMVEEGVADPAQIDEVVRGTFGFRLPMYGPCTIADMAGLDVCSGIYQTMEQAYGDRFSVPPVLASMVQDGRLGHKQGGGLIDRSAAEISALVERRDRSYAAMTHFLRGLDENTGDATQ